MLQRIILWFGVFAIFFGGSFIGLSRMLNTSSAPASAASPAVPAPTANPPVTAAFPAASAAASGTAATAPGPNPAPAKCSLPSWAGPAARSTCDPATGLREEVVDPQTGIQLVLVPPGKFQRGADPQLRGNPDTQPQHEVTFTRPFYLGKTEVTQEEWTKVMKANPSRDKQLDHLPVTDVSWNDIREFDRRTGFRLPTEAEWEYACQSGGEGEPFLKSPDADLELKDSAWIAEVSGGRANQVGKLKPNGLGLYDIRGNVSEWTANWYDAAEYYRVRDGVTDPEGPPRGDARVIRGASFGDGHAAAFCHIRRAAQPDNRAYWLGFRVARNP